MNPKILVAQVRSAINLSVFDLSWGKGLPSGRQRKFFVGGVGYLAFLSLRTIRPQVTALGIIPLGLFLGILIALGFVYSWASRAADASVRANRILELGHRVSALELVAEATAGDYATMRRDSARRRFLSTVRDLRAARTALAQQTSDDAAEFAIVDPMLHGLDVRLASLEAAVRIARAGDSAKSLTVLSSRASGKAFVAFTNGSSQLDTLERTRQDRGATQVIARIRCTFFAIVAVTVAAGVVTTLLMIAVGVFVMRRLERLTVRAETYARTGQALPEVGGSDELALLDRTLTDLVAAVDQREALLKRYQLLADAAQDAMIFVDDHTDRIVEVNAMAAAMFGYERSEMIDLPASAIRGPDAVLQGEAIATRKDGSTFPVDVRTALSQTPEQRLHLAIMRDITERRHAEAALRSALAQAVDASRMKSEFVSTMSHEIRTPMNAVIGMSELLLETELSAEQKEYVRVLRSSGQSLLAVINDILDFSKIEAGRMELSYEEFSLLAIAEDAASMVAETARRKHLELMTFVDPSIPACLVGDANRLRQVLVNLVSNAVKFTERGSVLLVAELVRLTSDNATIDLETRDTGIGMTSDQITRLFQAFRQADGSTSRRFGGTGLGLAISQSLVNAMGGEIRVESEPHAGSRFFFSLTLPYIAETPLQPSRHEVFAGMKVLVIDDDPTARAILSRYLTSWQVEHELSVNRTEAIALLSGAQQNGAPFKAVLIDLRLENDDGFEVARAINAMGTQAPALIMVTAYDSAEQGKRAIEAGFSAYLLKPIRQSQLYDVLLRIANGDEFLPSLPRGETSSTSTRSSARILLAEDNEINQRLAIRQLALLGYDDVTIAANGQEAIDAISAGDRFDLILMDVHMPLVDGFTAARTIRRLQSQGERTPILAMTANAMAHDRDESVAAGMDDHISKPVSMDMLREKVTAWLPQLPERPAVLDRTRLRDLFGDDEQEIRVLLGAAAASLSKSMERLTFADETSAAELAHDVKGAAANIGAIELSERAAALERALRGTNGVAADVALRDLRDAYGRLENAINGGRK